MQGTTVKIENISYMFQNHSTIPLASYFTNSRRCTALM